MHKKILVLAVSLILSLSGCGATTDQPAAPSGISTKLFTDQHFTINYPTGWILKTRPDFGPQIPQETLVTFSSPDPQNGYQNTLSIVNDTVPNGTRSLEYAQANINNAIKSVLEFEKIEERDVTIGDEQTKLLIFKGKSNLDALTLRYVQLYLVQAERGYAITGSMLVDADTTTQKMLEDLVLSFRLK